MRPPVSVTIVALMLATNISSFGQHDTGANPFMNDSNGRPLYLKTNFVADGSPYLFDDYLPATLTTDKGQVYKDVMVKVNLVNNEVIYRLPDGKEMISTKPIFKIVMPSVGMLYPGADSLIISGLNAAINSKGAGSYIISSSGKLTLLKKVSISFKDTQEYGNTNSTRVFTRKESFNYLDETGIIDKLPKSGSSVMDLFTAKRKFVEAYVSQNKFDLRNEKHLVSTFNYYNSLF